MPTDPRLPKTVEHIGHRLRAYRIGKGQTQDELAVRLGVSTDTLTAWELGRNAPQVRHYPKFEKLLGPLHGVREDASLGARLKVVRQSLGLTQKDMAAKLGLDPGTVRLIELGKRKHLRQSTRAIIAERLNALQGQAID